MEATALCVRLFLHVFMLLVAKDELCHSYNEPEAASLHIVANRLQLFEYQSISFDCIGFDESTEWRVMRRIMGVRTICGTEWDMSIGPCHIEHAFEADSGEYWCEAHGGRRSGSVNITVTAGSVILDSPAVSVTQGKDATLVCINKTSSSVPVADFYKDGIWKGTGYKGNITIRNVSKSDEGLYKCVIAGVGESPESWLAIRTSSEKRPSNHRPSEFPILWIICLVAVLIGVVGLGVCWKHKATICVSPDSSVPRSQSYDTGRVFQRTRAAQPQRAVYSLITATRSCGESEVSRFQAAPVTDRTTTAECIYYNINY